MEYKEKFGKLSQPEGVGPENDVLRKQGTGPAGDLRIKKRSYKWALN